MEGGEELEETKKKGRRLIQIIQGLRAHNSSFHGSLPGNIYFLMARNRNTKNRCKICSKLALLAPEQRQ